MRRRRHLALRVIGLALALGATVVVSWIAVRGFGIWNGPGPFLDPSWFVVWAVQAVLAAIVAFSAQRVGRSSVNGRTAAAVVLAAWLGELVALFVIAPFLAGELTSSEAPTLWLIATGGPIQPLAAMVGAWVGIASNRAT